jgi:DNA-binding TFAR19-related protein (PDSD5 family)
MNDRELEVIKQKKLKELQKRIAFREHKREQVDGDKILNRAFKGRAWEVFNAVKSQFPVAMDRIESLLVNLAMEGKSTQIKGNNYMLF